MDRAKKVSPPSRPASKANAAPKEQVNFERRRVLLATMRPISVCRTRGGKKTKERKGT